jgi:uncharacterized FAD-dependent dehydrogenase
MNRVWEYQKRFEERYLLAGGKIIAQRYRDIGRETFSQIPTTTTLHDYRVGSIFSVMPRDSVFAILESINKFNQITGGKFINEETIICAPEFGNFWPEIKVDKNFFTSAKGVFVAGDALGFIRGAMQACVTGLKAARGIKLFLNKEAVR